MRISVHPRQHTYNAPQTNVLNNAYRNHQRLPTLDRHRRRPLPCAPPLQALAQAVTPVPPLGFTWRRGTRLPGNRLSPATLVTLLYTCWGTQAWDGQGRTPPPSATLTTPCCVQVSALPLHQWPWDDSRMDRGRQVIMRLEPDGIHDALWLLLRGNDHLFEKKKGRKRIEGIVMDMQNISMCRWRTKNAVQTRVQRLYNTPVSWLNPICTVMRLVEAHSFSFSICCSHHAS
jgi:hypothetical protein